MVVETQNGRRFQKVRRQVGLVDDPRKAPWFLSSQTGMPRGAPLGTRDLQSTLRICELRQSDVKWDEKHVIHEAYTEWRG